MRAALAESERVQAPPAGRRRSLQVVQRPPATRGLGLRHRPGLLLIGFAVCLALLAVGRVTLSFAVVQKTLQTEALVRQQRALEAGTVRLQDEIARLAAAPRIRREAVERLGLVPAQGVIYLNGGVAGAHSKPAAGRTPVAGGAPGEAGAMPAGVAGSGGP